MSEKRVFDINNEEDWLYSEPHTNHVSQTKKESIISEVLGDSYYDDMDFDDGFFRHDEAKGILGKLRYVFHLLF